MSNMQNTHIHFNDNDEVVECAREIAPSTSDILADDSSSESTWEYISENGEEIDDSEFNAFTHDSCHDYSSDDASTFVNIRTHRAASSRFRVNVKMDAFSSLHSHLKIVEEMDARAATTLVGRVAEYIGWTMHDNGISQEEAVDRIVNVHPLGVLKYVAVLKGPESRLKNGTVYNTLLDIDRWATYLAIYENQTVDKLHAILKAQQKSENKKKKKDIHERFSRENLIQNKQWPKNGMAELVKLLMAQQGRIDRLIQKAADGNFIDAGHLRFTSDWVLALVFTINPQGRSQAISKLTVKEGKQLCDVGGESTGGQITSTRFKTSPTYGSQSINCSPLTLKYVEAYMDHIRPYMIGSSASDALFVNQSGLPYTDVGVCVTRLYRQISKYHITTTLLRSMFETEAAEAVDHGKLTHGEIASVFRNSGHSSNTAAAYYLKAKAKDVGQQAMQVHAKLYGADQQLHPTQVSSNADSRYSPDASSSEDELTPPRRRRINWTVDELSHLGSWVSRFEKANGRRAIKNWRDCVKEMTDTGIFHCHHLTAVALRDAWRREESKNERRMMRDV
jgi:hypothetical protein